ncbi:hypothetical protein [Methylobacterium trifolii]|uniref:Uncharacterized protein n=1 Tax=Methylobacterium trifolii TaxID=1003092 RepID=A0ABQ4TWK4_9HYPH|nr:hypothetical protein [Methylobacterium trifolii]GJE59638.1 hypothetical protein MPOCJGCO_1735 [Methylobacterium trifolii]
MNVPAALVVQSVPFAGLVLASDKARSGTFAILYCAAFGLLMSLVLLNGDDGSFSAMLSGFGQIE